MSFFAFYYFYYKLCKIFIFENVYISRDASKKYDIIKKGADLFGLYKRGSRR